MVICILVLCFVVVVVVVVEAVVEVSVYPLCVCTFSTTRYNDLASFRRFTKGCSLLTLYD